MSWRDRYRTASFRGVEFYVEAHTADLGRRLTTHEYPGRDESYTEDLGRRTGEYRVEGYYVGDDYDLERDRLVAVCLQPGPAELVHPYLGSLEVICADVSVSENNKELRTCRISMLFIEAGVPKYPGAGEDAVRSVTGAAAGVVEAAEAGFLDRFATAGLPSFVGQAAAVLTGGLAGLLEQLPINPLAAAQTVAGFFAQVGQLRIDALSLVASPGELAARVIGILTAVRDVYGTRAPAVLSAVRQAYPVPPAAASTATPARRQEAENETAFAALVREVVIAEHASAAVIAAEESAAAIAEAANSGMGAAASGAVFQTRNDALAVRDELTEAIDAEMESPGLPDPAYVALAALRAKVVAGLPSPDLRLPRVAVITPPATVPSLVLAYRIYANAGRAAEIAERNRAPHPGFLPGGQPLEVIGDA